MRGDLDPFLPRMTHHTCLVTYDRDREPWEASDGALHLMEQLALAVTSASVAPPGALGAAPPSPPPAGAAAAPALLDAIVQLLPSLPDLAELRSFRKAAALRETLWTCLPGIARALGKSDRESTARAGSPFVSQVLCITRNSIPCPQDLPFLHPSLPPSNPFTPLPQARPALNPTLRAFSGP